MSGAIPVQFPNRDGLQLSGILHLPKTTAVRPVAIMLLSPGVKMRVGPHRLYNKMTERFLCLGFPVLRFDYYGLGDSEGDLPESVLVEVYNTIQTGRFVPDTIDAMDWMQREHGVSRFIASGLCGGAISGLLAAERDHRLEALLALGIPVSFEGSEQHWGRYITRGQLKELSHGYVRRLSEPGAWLRFLTFQSDYRVIWRSMRERYTTPTKTTTAAPATAATNDAPPSNLNPQFAPAFFSMLERSRPMLLLFGGADRWMWEFEEKFESPNATRLAPYRAGYEKHTIDSANHILSDEQWLTEMLDLSEAWLRKTYPA